MDISQLATYPARGYNLTKVKLELFGGNLLAANNNDRCGGANVSFGNVYKRAR